MLATIISKYGENLIKNGISDKFGFVKKPIKVTFIIDSRSNLLEVQKHEKAKERLIPLGIYNNCFSTSRVTESDIPFPLFDKIESLTDECRKEIYFKELTKFAQEINDPIIDCIKEFIPSFDWKSILDEEINEKSFFDVLVKYSDHLEDVSNNKKLIEKINNNVLKKVISTEAEGTDSFGRNYTSLIRKHSVIDFPGLPKPRVISEKAYKEDYYWDEKDPLVCKVSPETELYLTVGMNYLTENISIKIGGRRYALCDINGNFHMCFNWNAKKFAEFYGEIVNLYPDWLQFEEKFMYKTKGMKLFYVEFDNNCAARLSTYKVYQYNEIESRKIIENILTWVRINSFWKAEEVYSFGNKIIDIIQKKVGIQTKDAFSAKAKDYVAFNSEYSKYINNVINGYFNNIAEEVIIPLLIDEIQNEKNTSQTLRLLSRIHQSEKKEYWFDKSISFKYGELAGYIYLYFKADNDYSILDQLYIMRNNPYRWACKYLEILGKNTLFLERKTTGYIKKKLEGLYKSKLNEIRSAKDFKKQKLDGEFFAGFDIAVEDFYYKGLKNSDIDNLLRVFRKSDLEIRKLDISDVDVLSEDEAISYKIIVEEYKVKKGEKNEVQLQNNDVV